MKKAFVAAAVLVATSAQASSGLDFGDINYFLKSNQLNLTSNLSIVDQEVKPAGAAREQVRGYILDNRLAYGIADNLNVFVGLDYGFMLERRTSGSPDSDISGLSNPAVGVNYRLMNQSDAAFNLDFGAVGRVRLMDAEYGSAGEDGTFNRGNHQIELNTAIGRKWNEANEWRITAAVIQNLEGEVEDTALNEDVDTTSSTDFSVTAAYQYRPVQEFMMLVSLQALRVGESEYEYSAGDLTDEAHLDWNFAFNAKYAITDKFIAKFEYGLSRLEEYDQKQGGATQEQKNRHANFYGFGIDWLF